jgi:hypothetical protein
MDNSKGQSPCIITAYLGGACYNGQFSVPALAPGFVYYGPYTDEANQIKCECNTVFYNIISACGLCQNSTIISWSQWNSNCTAPSSGVFPPGIPAGTAVPQWAFQDVTASNMFNVTIAQLVGDNPESTATVQSTSSVAATTTSVAASLTPSPSVSGSNPPSSSSKSNTGAIVGGVVGGVAGLALLVGVAFAIFSIMRKKRQIPPSAQFAGAPIAPVSPAYTATTFAPEMAQPKYYDPSDPSTFPTTPDPTSPTFSTPSIRPGGYTGVPEI